MTSRKAEPKGPQVAPARKSGAGPAARAGAPLRSAGPSAPAGGVGSTLPIASGAESGRTPIHVVRCPDGRARAFYFAADTQGDEVCQGLNFAEGTWRMWGRATKRAEHLAFVDIPLCPLSEPTSLSALEDDLAEVVVRCAWMDHDYIGIVGIVRQQVRGLIERAVAGRLSVHEAAAVIARLNGGPERRRPTLEEERHVLWRAVAAGDLVLLDASTDRRISPADIAAAVSAAYGLDAEIPEDQAIRYATGHGPEGLPFCVMTIEALADWYSKATGGKFQLNLCRGSDGLLVASKQPRDIPAASLPRQQPNDAQDAAPAIDAGSAAASNAASDAPPLELPPRPKRGKGVEEWRVECVKLVADNLPKFEQENGRQGNSRTGERGRVHGQLQLLYPEEFTEARFDKAWREYIGPSDSEDGS